MDVWMYECKDVQIHGCLDVWMYTLTTYANVMLHYSFASITNVTRKDLETMVGEVFSFLSRVASVADH